jgi:hypothetical protein
LVPSQSRQPLVGGSQRSTLLGQVQRDLPADTAAGSGHDRDLPSEG